MAETITEPSRLTPDELAVVRGWCAEIRRLPAPTAQTSEQYHRYQELAEEAVFALPKLLADRDALAADNGELRRALRAVVGIGAKTLEGAP